MTQLRPEALEQILDVTRKLAAPFDLTTMLLEVVDAARNVLDADRGSVFMYDKEQDELVLKVATDLAPIRIPADKGIVGECAQTRKVINVPDCYADERFNRDIDKKSGYHSRCMLTQPLIGHDDSLIGVLQILNKKGGPFDADDETVGAALAAQCAVALHRVQMMETMLMTEKLDREISVARDIQMGTLPAHMPELPGYDVAGTFQPADQTGGDTFDFVQLDPERLFILLGDATGHGIGPALSATQVRAMLRMALRLHADLDATFKQINDQLVEDLPDDRFVTAFLGLLDTGAHTVRFHAGGQGPLLHYHPDSIESEWFPPSTFPMGCMPQINLKEAQTICLEKGDVLALISDGVFEYENETGRQFGEGGVSRAIRQNHERPMTEVVDILMEAVRAHGGEVPQADDITIVLVRRLP